MEQEHNNTPTNAANQEEQRLINLITTTFRGKTKEEIRSAQKQIIEGLNLPGVLQKLVKIMIGPNEYQLTTKKSIALIIKKYSYECANSPGHKVVLIESIYKLLISEQLQLSIKEVLGTALHPLISLEKHLKYRKMIFDNTLQLLSLQNSISKLDGYLIALSTCFNAENEFQVQFHFFQAIYQLLAKNGMKILSWVSTMEQGEWNARAAHIVQKVRKYFEVLEDMIEQLTQTVADLENEEAEAIWQSQTMVQLLHSFLLFFHNNNSIISIYCPALNPMKKTILNIVTMIYKERKCPQGIFKSIYFTFLAQAHTIINHWETQQILMKCLEMLDDHLSRDLYMQVFLANKMDTIFAILLYSVTNHQEYQLIQENPQKFVQLAEDYTQANERNDYLKVKAGNFFRVLVVKMDQALRNIIQIVLMISSEIIQNSKNSQRVQLQLKEAFSKYTFYSLSFELKLQACFMVMAALAEHINRRIDLKQLVVGFFQSNFNILIDITSNLVILRLIRAVSYYPMVRYFYYVELEMTKGKIFILEGIKSFERILRKNSSYPEIRKLLAGIFTNLIGVLKIDDPIMELMILNCYDTMLKTSSQLYRRCRNKIKQEFFINIESNQHASLICFNLIQGLLIKEKEQIIRNELINQFMEIAHFLLIKQNHKFYFLYEQNIIQIFTQIINLRSFTSPQIQNYVEQTLRFLSRYEKGSKIFKLYNSFILHLQGAVFKLEQYFNFFWQQLELRVQRHLELNQPLQAVAYFCFLMSQIISNNSNLNLNQDQLTQLFKITNVVPTQYKQYFLLIFLSFICQCPASAVKYLREKGAYESFINDVMQVEFNGVLPKKILILALIRLIQFEQNFNTFQVILNYCLQYLKLQSKKSRGKITTTHTEIKPRSHGQERSIVTYTPNQEEQYNDNQLINLFVNFKHPYRSLSQFDNFKVILQHRHGFLKQLPPQVLQDIRDVLQTQWVDSKTRKIVKVARE